MKRNSSKNIPQPSIRELAVIGDRRTCALIDKEGTVAWYCPWRFDQPSVFSLLIDTNGGFWSVEAEGKKFTQRQYKNNSAILITEFITDDGSFSVTDFMPVSDDITGICRIFSPSHADINTKIFLTPDYGQSSAKFKIKSDATAVFFKKEELYLKTSHPVSVDNNEIIITIPAGQPGWAVLTNDKTTLPGISGKLLDKSLATTEKEWDKISGNISYTGPYKEQVHQSFKAIQLLTHQHSGGIVAAATTSLPEVIGEERNYDYRYVWLRDTAMVASALIRVESKGDEADRFLEFLCRSRSKNKKRRFVPLYDLDGKTAPDEVKLSATGYRNSQPVRAGNDAFEQLQLDANANVLLAAKQIYGKDKSKPHWETAEYIADYLVKNWKKKDHGIWEEHIKRHFTSGKVIVAKSLEFIAEHAETQKQADRWRKTAGDIRRFVAEKCMTADGAYAVYAGSEDVDITAALYPVWLYDEPDSKEMKQTIQRLENEYKEGELYHRQLELVDSMKEGVFLAGCFWMAQYYIMLKDLEKAKKIIDAAIEFSNDLGFFAEEGDITAKEMLGNFPQTFVHASFIGAVIDYKNAVLEKS